MIRESCKISLLYFFFNFCRLASGYFLYHFEKEGCFFAEKGVEYPAVIAMSTNWKENYLAKPAFYRKIGNIALPLALQQVLNQGAGFVDTIMVSRVGGVSAVAVATQLDNLMGTVSFGVNSGINIFSSQFFGAKDWKSLKKCFGFQLVMNFLTCTIFFLIATLAGHAVLRFYANNDTLAQLAWQYMKYCRFHYFFSAITNAFTFMYRSIQKTKVPMFIGFGINIINAFLNYLLIFGKLGLPQMGISGAALATVIANGCGALAHVIYAFATHQPFLGSIPEITDWSIPFLKPMVRRMLPLIANEAMFGFGNSMYVKAYGLLGTAALETYKIGNTVGSFFYVAVQGMNNAVGIVVGEQLGKKDLEGARHCVRCLFPVSGSLAVLMAILVSLFARPLVSLFGLTDPVVAAGSVIMVRLFALRIAFRLFNVIFMSTIRAGGDAIFLMFLDCGVLWAVGVPLAFLSVNVFGVTQMTTLFAIIQSEQIVRMLIGIWRYRQGKWCRNLTDETKAA